MSIEIEPQLTFLGWDTYFNEKFKPYERDDYVPADNLVAPMFEERYGFKKKGD